MSQWGAMGHYRLAVIGGDRIGPEVMAEALASSSRGPGPNGS